MTGDPTEGDGGGGAGAVGPRAPKVFCSYGSPDREVVTELARWLRENGVDAWIDLWELVPGESFIAGIEEGLAAAELVLVFLSRASEARVWRQAEVEAAIDRMVREGIRVVPVMIDADAHVPMLLRSRSGALGIGERERLLAAITGRSEKPVLGPPPERWSERARQRIEEGLAAVRQGGARDTTDRAAARSLQQREELAKADPDSAQAKRDLSVSLNMLGDVEVQVGNLAGARDLFQRSLQQREELAKADPDSAVASFDVVLSQMRFLMLAAQAEDIDALREHLTAAKTRLDAMDAKAQIAGDKQREAVKAMVDEAAAQLPPP